VDCVRSERHTIWLPDHKQQTFIFRNTVREHSVAFYLQIDYTVGNKLKHHTITNGGQPFRITGLHCAPQRGFVAYQRAYTFDGSFRLTSTAARLKNSQVGVPSSC
jgi:hypothetical protein